MLKIHNFFKSFTVSGEITHNFVFTLFFVLFAFLPDWVVTLIYHLPIKTEFLFLFGVMLFGFLLSFTPTVMIYVFMGIIFVIQLFELNFTVYFGDAIKPQDIMNVIRERQDVFDLTYLKQVWLAPTLLLICMIFALKSLKHRLRLPFVFLLVLYMAAHKPYRAYTESKGIWYFQPAITRPTLKNSISTFSYFLFQYYPKGYEQQSVTYLPYEIREISSDTQNILLIWGESLYAPHMNIYGYERETFPRLSRKLAEDDGFMTAMGESGGIATATSTLLFFNGVREPANAQELAKGTANLFKLAKEHGFETYYYSNQESRLTMGMQSKYIDHLETNDANPVFFARYKDEGLVKMLEEIDFSKGKHFVVLHMRSPHSPYENRYKGREAEFEKFVPAETADNRFDYTVNTYDNALLYTDMVLDKMVTLYLEKTENTKSSLYMTADHGQLFNFQGHWGHNNLLLEQGRVPFFAKMNHRPDDFPETISHYEIGKLIARDIGAEIINPNETDRIMFLHGNNIDFPYDFITYKILSDGQLEKINMKNTLELSK